MGYNTNFSGELKFKNELTIPELNKLETFFGEDCREHPEWNSTHLYYIDLEINEDRTGIKWDGSEKSSLSEEIINLILLEMQKEFPDFRLEGEFLAQGEDIDDRYCIRINNEVAEIILIKLKPNVITCPHCEKILTL